MITVPNTIAKDAWLEMEANNDLILEIDGMLPCCQAKVFPPDAIIPGRWEIYCRHSRISATGNTCREALLGLKEQLIAEVKKETA